MNYFLLVVGFLGVFWVWTKNDIFRLVQEARKSRAKEARAEDEPKEKLSTQMYQKHKKMSVHFE